MVFEKLDYLLPMQWGKHPLFFWVNRSFVVLLRAIPYQKISILNVLKTTAILNLLLSVIGISLHLNKKILKLTIPILFILAPFFLIYFSIGTVENIIIPIVFFYWYCFKKFISDINSKKWRPNYFFIILLGLMIALTKSNSASIIVSSILVFVFYIFKDYKKNIWKWIGLLSTHIVFLSVNLYIAFHYSQAESNNVMSLIPNLSAVFGSIIHYFSYTPYFFSFTFLLLLFLTTPKILNKKLFKIKFSAINIILIINLVISFIVIMFLKVYYPRYYLIAFLPLFLLLAKYFESFYSNFFKNKARVILLVLFLLLDFVFVVFPSLVYKWRIPQIDITQHFDRSSIHIPYDFKKNVLDKNPKSIFLINDDRYGANNLFYGLIPISIKNPNFKIIVYEDINKLNPIDLCKRYRRTLIYIWGDSSLTKNKQVIQNILLKSYYSFNKKESINIYKLLCK